MTTFPIEGGCDCGKVRYSMQTPPFCMHACHCLWCQRETGSAFALNASIEKDRIKLLPRNNDGSRTQLDWGKPLPSASGAGQWVGRCPDCKVGVVSIYGSDFDKPDWVVRVGTLDDPDALSPYLTAHIYTSTKLPWLKLDMDEGAKKGKVPVFEESYNVNEFWGEEQLERYRRVCGKEPGWW